MQREDFLLFLGDIRSVVHVLLVYTGRLDHMLQDKGLRSVGLRMCDATRSRWN